MAGNNSDIGIDEFPFLAHDKPRPGQIDMIRECRESLRNKGHHIAAAPTGIGKTAASIAAALEVAMNTSTKPHILFLTGRQSQHKIVIETVRKINSRLGNTHRDIKVVDIIGRDQALVEQANKGSKMIWVTFRKEGIHKYPAALDDPKLATGDRYDVSFLGYPHKQRNKRKDKIRKQQFGKLSS